jgi:adenylate cyclase
MTLGVILSFSGRPEEGIGLMEKAMRLNPRYPAGYLASLGVAYREAGRYEEAITLAKKALARSPNVVGTHASLAVCYVELGRLEEARAEVAEILRLNPDWSLEVLRQNVPLKDTAVLERRIAALRKVGMK